MRFTLFKFMEWKLKRELDYKAIPQIRWTAEKVLLFIFATFKT